MVGARTARKAPHAYPAVAASPAHWGKGHIRKAGPTKRGGAERGVGYPRVSYASGSPVQES